MCIRFFILSIFLLCSMGFAGPENVQVFSDGMTNAVGSFVTQRSKPVFQPGSNQRVRGQMQFKPGKITSEKVEVPDFRGMMSKVSEISNTVSYGNPESIPGAFADLEQADPRMEGKIVPMAAVIRTASNFTESESPTDSDDPNKHKEKKISYDEDKFKAVKADFMAAGSGLLGQFSSKQQELDESFREAAEEARRQQEEERQNRPSPTPQPQQTAGGGGGGGGGGKGGGGDGAGKNGADVPKLDAAAFAEGTKSLFAQAQTPPKGIEVDPSLFSRGIASVSGPGGVTPVSLTSGGTVPPAVPGNPSKFMGQSAAGGPEPQIKDYGLTGGKSVAQALSASSGIPPINQPSGDGGAAPKLGGGGGAPGGSIVSGDPYSGNGVEKPYKPVNYNLVKEAGYGSAGGGGEGGGDGEFSGVVDGGGSEGTGSGSASMKSLASGKSAPQFVQPIPAEKGGGAPGVLAYAGLVRTICLSPRAKSVGVCGPRKSPVRTGTVALVSDGDV